MARFVLLSQYRIWQGPEVVIAPVVLAERELLQKKARKASLADEDKDDCVVDQQEAADERKTEGEVVEEKEHNPGDDGDVVVCGNGGLAGEHSKHVLEQVQKDFPPENMAASMKVLQRGASSLLRFLVAVSMRQASTARPVEVGEDGLQASRDKAPRPPEDGHQVLRGGQEEPAKADNGAAVAVLPPTRERSMYGTPLKQMQAHVDSLHQVTTSRS